MCRVGDGGKEQNGGIKVTGQEKEGNMKKKKKKKVRHGEKSEDYNITFMKVTYQL